MSTTPVVEKRTYAWIWKNGKHVVGLPFGPHDWFVYAAPSRHAAPSLELWWVNHDTQECCEYIQFATDKVTDPSKYPYNMCDDKDMGEVHLYNRYAETPVATKEELDRYLESVHCPKS